MILPILGTYNFIMIAAAVIPAVYLMIKVYRADRLEPESPALLVSLVVSGILSAMLALVEEMVLQNVLNMFAAQGTLLYNILLYFGVVAVSEESSKYLLMKRKTWKDPEFDCKFDGIIYAVFVSLGFALWENISYVYSYGLATAVVRAVTAIPGHACFGVFMGLFYSIAKEYDHKRNSASSSFYRKLALIVPVLLHGSYDFITSIRSSYGDICFIVFVGIMFLISLRIVNKLSKEDDYMSWHIVR